LTESIGRRGFGVLLHELQAGQTVESMVRSELCTLPPERAGKKSYLGQLRLKVSQTVGIRRDDGIGRVVVHELITVPATNVRSGLSLARLIASPNSP
jgi:hypothetical protein